MQDGQISIKIFYITYALQFTLKVMTYIFRNTFQHSDDDTTIINIRQRFKDSMLLSMSTYQELNKRKPNAIQGKNSSESINISIDQEPEAFRIDAHPKFNPLATTNYWKRTTLNASRRGERNSNRGANARAVWARTKGEKRNAKRRKSRAMGEKKERETFIFPSSPSSSPSPPCSPPSTRFASLGRDF